MPFTIFSSHIKTMTLSFCSWLADCGEARPQQPDRSRLEAQPLPLLPSHSLTQVFLLLILDKPLPLYLQAVQTETTHPHAPVCNFCSLVCKHGILEGVLTKIKNKINKKKFSKKASQPFLHPLHLPWQQAPAHSSQRIATVSLHGAWRALPYLSQDMPHWRLSGRTEQGDDRLDFSFSRHMLCLVRKMMSE